MRLYMLAIPFLLSVLPASAQNGNVSASRPATPFPSPEFVLRDAKHKEQKSGVQLQGGQLTIASGVGTPTSINSLSFSADGKILAAGKDFGRLVLWEVQEKRFLQAMDTKQGQVKSVAVSPDGKVVASGGNQDGDSVKLWDLASGKELWKFTQANGEINQLLFVAEGKKLIVADNASNVYVLNAGDGKTIAKLPNLHLVGGAADGESIITTDGTEFAAWNINTLTKTQSIPIPSKASMLLTVSLAADRFATFEKRVLKVGQFSTGKTILELPDLVSKNFTWRPDFAAFNPEGTVAYLSLDSRLIILDARTGNVCGGPTMYSGAGAVSPDGRWFAGAKDDSIISQERTDGVWVWSTKSLLQKCGVNSASREASR
ncbi:MAG: PQQ-binding-like beta-propeller repeat protein [Candidatus Acidiferrum sp.]